MKGWLILALLLFSGAAQAQVYEDSIYMSNIGNVSFFKQNNQQSMPVIHLNSDEQLELYFDDMVGYPKNYYYTFVLCNANWTPADVSIFDYLKGFQQQAINQYRISSITREQYVSYHLLLPDAKAMPAVSGNYILKVFLDGDTAQLAFTRRFFVVHNRVDIAANVAQPFTSQLFLTHQKVQLSINTRELNILNPQQQLKVVIMQNYRWDNAITGIQPIFMNNNIYQYNAEQDCVFPGGKEYRWANLESFRYQSERVASIDKSSFPYQVYLKNDEDLSGQPYLLMNDINGWYTISTTEMVNPWWQTDYAYVHFSFVPPGHHPFTGQNIYILGALTGNRLSNNNLMQFNADKGIYEKTLFLKQGYYNYTYVTRPADEPNAPGILKLTDGNSWETENDYTIFVYYRSLNDRYDELVGVTTINSRFNRQ
jgi:DNA-binding protein Fis